MSKGLQALQVLYETMPFVFEEDKNKIRCLETIEKELKALKIIEFKEVDMSLLHASFAFEKEHKTLHGVIYYNANIKCFGRQLTQEEYDILREVLL